MGQVLVIEQDKRHFELIKRCVEAHGHRAFWTSKPADALDLLEQHSFQMIVCGANLDNGDVFAMLRSVRNNLKTSATPFVFCCADEERARRFATPTIQRAAVLLGATKYVVLPGFNSIAQLWDSIKDCMPPAIQNAGVVARTYSFQWTEPVKKVS